MSLNVAPIFDNSHSCLENSIATMANWWKRNHIGMYARNWYFSFKSLKSPSQIVGDRLSSGVEDCWEFIKKYHGFRSVWYFKEDYKEQINLIKEELADGNPVMVCMDGYFIHWNKHYNLQHAKHYFIIIGLNDSLNMLECIDPHTNNNREESKLLPLINFKEGNAKCIKIWVEGNEYQSFNFLYIVEEAMEYLRKLNVYGRNSFQDMLVFADEVENIMDLKKEMDFPNIPPLHFRLRCIGMGRFKFSRLLIFLSEINGLNEFMNITKKLDEFGQRWMDIRKLYHETSKLDDIDEQQKIVKESSNEIRAIAEGEEKLLFNLSEIVNDIKKVNC